MRRLCSYIILLYGLLFPYLPVIAQSTTPVQLPANWKQQGYVLQLKDELQHPDVSWPVTLLQYRLQFGNAGVTTKQFSVTDMETGKPVAFQLAGTVVKNGLLQEATLYLLSDLPSGTIRLFRLQAKAAAAVLPANAIRVENAAQGITIGNGKIRLQIPGMNAAKALPPVMQIGNDTAWLGRGEWPAAHQPVRMQVQALEAGSITAAYRIIYTFDNTKIYSVHMRVTAGMEFAEVDEEMTGFRVTDSLGWRMIWNGVQPNVRYASTRAGIAGKGANNGSHYHSFLREPMEGYPGSMIQDKHPYESSDQRNGHNGQLPFRLALYDNWMSWWRLPTAAFWQEQANATTVGLFIKDAEQWNDGQYALWGSKPALSITYHWNNGVLDYRFPLVNGTRSTGLALYPHTKDITCIDRNRKPLAYIDQLRRWYGWVSLNKTKNWILNYNGNDGAFPKYFNAAYAGNKLNLGWLQQSLKNMVTSVATGAERNAGPTPVGARVFYENIVPSFDLNRNAMDSAQYRQLRAWFLFMNYIFMDEGLMPMRTMLSGHPNFLMDIKTVAGLSAFLFPAHPGAKQMASHLEKAIQLNYQFHIRPTVKPWNAQGGRWTENLGTYTWAGLRPTLRTNYLLHHYFDGKNRILQPGISDLGNWLLHALTSPLQPGNRRGFPPQGAHAQDFKEGPPDLLRMLAQDLVYYDPLLAEHLFWVTDSTDKAFEGEREMTSIWKHVLSGPWAGNKGTQPQLRSSKFTGYGITLRSHFAQPNEMYVHLQQIDEGPNYRWGRAGNGGNGVIYYYANGKRYSFNGPEDVGDGPFGDVERCTSFGVALPMPEYSPLRIYKGIGRNELTAPLYNFGFAQQATIYGNDGRYRSRSILQSGADYIVVFDDVADSALAGRFSWFTGREDDFPFIHQLTPGVNYKDASLQPSQSNYHKDPAVLPTKGRYYDGNGDFLTVVTHLQAVQVQKTNYGAQVQLPDGNTDHVFRSDNTIQYNQGALRFTGRSGIIKQTATGKYQAALFEGATIGAGELRIELKGDSGAGISFQPINRGYAGKYQSISPQTIQFYNANKTGYTFYIDGFPVTTQLTAADAIAVSFPAGMHEWQWSASGVIPGMPLVTGTINNSGGCSIHWNKVAGAVEYEVQVSKDKGASWQTAISHAKDTSALLTNLNNEMKIHARVLANGKDTVGEASAAYPIYVTAKTPHCPEGLQVRTDGIDARLQWGQILGAGEYKLYRRIKAAKDTSWQLVYSGTQRMYTDVLPDTATIYEYSLSAVNGNGESSRSVACDTDPNSWLNWYPPNFGFRRDTEGHENGFPEFNPFIEEAKPVLQYPR